MPSVTKEQAKKYKLYEYQNVNFYSQRNILGMDSV
jgi:hypothetical protein